MPDLKHDLHLDEGISHTGGVEAARYTVEPENPSYSNEAGMGKDVATFTTWKINPRLACRLNNRLRRL